MMFRNACQFQNAVGRGPRVMVIGRAPAHAAIQSIVAGTFRALRRFIVCSCRFIKRMRSVVRGLAASIWRHDTEVAVVSDGMGGGACGYSFEMPFSFSPVPPAIRRGRRGLAFSGIPVHGLSKLIDGRSMLFGRVRAAPGREQLP